MKYDYYHGYDSRTIANYFLKLAQNEIKQLTNMQLQILTYIAHGWSLALRDFPLIRDYIKAKSYGPCFPNLYSSLAKYGSGSVMESIRENDSDPGAWALDKRGNKVKEILTQDDINIINAVWNNYQDFNDFQLLKLIKKSGTPWNNIFNKFGNGSIIPNELIKNYYLKLLGKDVKSLKFIEIYKSIVKLIIGIDIIPKRFYSIDDEIMYVFYIPIDSLKDKSPKNKLKISDEIHDISMRIIRFNNIPYYSNIIIDWE